MNINKIIESGKLGKYADYVWFAWYPVQLVDGSFKWLEYVIYFRNGWTGKCLYKSVNSITKEVSEIRELNKRVEQGEQII